MCVNVKRIQMSAACDVCGLIVDCGRGVTSFRMTRHWSDCIVHNKKRWKEKAVEGDGVTRAVAS